MDKIPIYDLNYLDCSKGQYVSYLKWCGYDVEALYYNAFESTDDVYEQIIVQNKMRWHYDERGFQDPDWALIGIEKHTLYAPHYAEIEGEIERVLERKQIAFLSADAYYLSNRTDVYQCHHEPHSIMLISIDPDSGQMSYLDETAPFLRRYSCPKQQIVEAYNSSYSLHTLTYFTPIASKETVQLAEVKKRYVDWLLSFHDQYLLYDRIGEIVASASSENKQQEMYRQLGAAFTLLNGSRERFADFVHFIQAGTGVDETLRQCAVIAESIRNLLNLASMTNRNPTPKVEKKCGLLKEMEMEVIAKLKGGIGG